MEPIAVANYKTKKTMKGCNETEGIRRVRRDTLLRPEFGDLSYFLYI